MGNLLGSPVTEKETHTGTDGSLQWGVSSMQGWRVHMEDAHITEGSLFAAELVAPPTPTTNATGAKNSSSSSREVKLKYKKIPLPGHSLFAIFDGHGGTFAAAYSGRNMCRVLSRQPKFVQYAKFTKERQEKEKTFTDNAQREQYIRSGLELLEEALCDTFVELDREIACALKASKVPDADKPYHNREDDEDPSDPVNNNSTSGDDTHPNVNPSSSNDSQTSSPTDSALQLLEEEGDSGTTACVVVVTPEWIVCANAGDSRAVFSRAGSRAVPLSYDHKPDDDEEERRIRAAGGYVAGGRVEGDLAVSRGLGDFRFKFLDVVMAGSASQSVSHSNNNAQENGVANTNSQHSASHQQQQQRRPDVKPGDQKVSPIPDIIVQNRNVTDEFIIIACDGIWDVQTNYEAVKMVAEMFQEGESNIGLICEEVCDVCLGMGSKDNMTALVIQFEGQKIGKGGGVLARRQLRDSENDGDDSTDPS